MALVTERYDFRGQARKVCELSFNLVAWSPGGFLVYHAAIGTNNHAPVT